VTQTAASFLRGQTSLTAALVLLLAVAATVAAVSLVVAGVQAAAKGQQQQLVVVERQAQVSEQPCSGNATVCENSSRTELARQTSPDARR
jgi:hypothetical protein